MLRGPLAAAGSQAKGIGLLLCRKWEGQVGWQEAEDQEPPELQSFLPGLLVRGPAFLLDRKVKRGIWPHKTKPRQAPNAHSKLVLMSSQGPPMLGVRR